MYVCASIIKIRYMVYCCVELVCNRDQETLNTHNRVASLNFGLNSYYKNYLYRYYKHFVWINYMSRQRNDCASYWRTIGAINYLIFYLWMLPCYRLSRMRFGLLPPENFRNLTLKYEHFSIVEAAEDKPFSPVVSIVLYTVSKSSHL